MNDFHQQVQTLIAEACQHPPGNPQRQRRLTQVIRLISGKLWRDYSPYYQDALQQTWIYFCRNVCEGETGRAYDPTRSTVVTWLNAYLKRRLQDGFIAVQQQKVAIAKSANPDMADPVDRLPAKPDIPPILEEVRTWAETAADSRLLTVHISQHPHITCQFLILQRLPPETPWRDLARDLGISIGTLSSFYQRKCMPLLQEFGRSQGYL